MSVYCAGLDLASFSRLSLDLRIRLAAMDLLGWRYSRSNSFPAARPGMPAQLAKPGVPNLGIDCSSLGSYVLITATPAGLWDSARYAELQIFDAAQRWSPMDAVERAKVGRKVESPLPGRWHVSQRWSTGGSGHFRLARADEADADRLLVIESTNAPHPLGGEKGPTWSIASVKALRTGGETRFAVIDP